jgi:hypothetical protein
LCKFFWIGLYIHRGCTIWYSFAQHSQTFYRNSFWTWALVAFFTTRSFDLTYYNTIWFEWCSISVANFARPATLSLVSGFLSQIKSTSQYVQQLDLLCLSNDMEHSLANVLTREQCVKLRRSSLGIQCEVFRVVVENRASILDIQWYSTMDSVINKCHAILTEIARKWKDLIETTNTSWSFIQSLTFSLVFDWLRPIIERLKLALSMCVSSTFGVNKDGHYAC